MNVHPSGNLEFEFYDTGSKALVICLCQNTGRKALIIYLCQNTGSKAFDNISVSKHRQ